MRWNGGNRPTTFVNSTTLTAQISAQDIAQAGSASITVINPAVGGAASNPLTFTIRHPALTLYYPRLTGAGDGEVTGIALANLEREDCRAETDWIWNVGKHDIRAKHHQSSFLDPECRSAGRDDRQSDPGPRIEQILAKRDG